MFPTETLSMPNTGKIIILAFPDTFVTMSNEWICKILPIVGLGTKDYIKAGHAALVLIENRSGKAKYFDFGRYVTPNGMGRVRGANTDAELQIPIDAKIDAHGNLSNLSEFLLWLEAHPEKTHGEGRLLASVCDFIDFDKAKKYIEALQDRGSIPYGAFVKEGSNCSRFVTDTILTATHDKTIKKTLLFNKKFTPSTVGNVEKASTGTIYEVFQGTIHQFKGTAFKENLKNYFHKKKSKSFKELGARNSTPAHWQKLSGIGSNAYFEFMQQSLPQYHFRIKRYNDSLDMDYDGVYYSEAFDAEKPYEFTYDSHCQYCHVIQDGVKIQLRSVSTWSQFNSRQKAQTA